MLILDHGTLKSIFCGLKAIFPQTLKIVETNSSPRDELNFSTLPRINPGTAADIQFTKMILIER